ncbi:MAG: leucine-rich repeat protein, partial [Muribaculaceae bacterium]|nr:leucine-rich repeat protein [Muribaculaceae bacterium]
YIPITSVTNNAPATYGSCSSGYTAQVTRIAPYACRNNTKLTSVGRSDLGAYTNFESVGERAFQGCTALTFVCIPCGDIYYAAFLGCTALTSVQLYSNTDIDKGVSAVYNYAFSECTNLHELMLTNKSICYVGNLGTTASDFKCYVPLRFYYSVYTDLSSLSSTAISKIHPFVRPENEWTPISCHQPLQLTSDAEFYIVETVTRMGDDTFIAHKKKVTGNVTALTGMMMKATPGTIYRLNVVSSGTNYSGNLLKSAVGKNYYEPTNYTSDLFYYDDDERYFLRWTTGVSPSGSAYMSYSNTNLQPYNIYFDGTFAPLNLKICNQRVTTENCGDLTVINGVSGEQVKFDPSTRTLTLKNATINGPISTEDDGITINVVGTNTTKMIWLDGGVPREISTITGGGTLNMLEPLYSDHDLTIKGGTKVSITGATPGQPQYETTDYAIENTSQLNNGHAYLTLEGAATELRITSAKHLIRSTLKLNDGLYIAQPKGTTLKVFGWSSDGGVLVDAYGNELYNTSVLITGAAPRGFKHNGLWYEQTGTNTVQFIEPQLGENYTGDVVIPEVFSRGTQVYVVTKIDTCAFSSTSVTSVEVPASVTSIDDKAFYGAKNLKSLLLLPDKAPNKYTLLGENFVGSNASGFTCYVKNNTLLTWMQTYNSINFLPWVVTNSDNGFLTFSCARNVTLPNGLTAYRVSGFDQARRMATTTKLTNSRIPSKNGVILKGEPGTCYLLSAATSPTAVGDNMLRSLLVTGDIPYAPLATNPDDSKAYFLGNSCQQWNEFQNNIDLFMKLNTGIAYLAVDKTLLGDDYTSPVQLDLWSTTTTVTGDVDGDGKVDVSDVNAVINIILKTKQASDYPGNADVDGDTKIDVSDVNVIINLILKVN